MEILKYCNNPPATGKNGWQRWLIKWAFVREAERVRCLQFEVDTQRWAVSFIPSLDCYDLGVLLKLQFSWLMNVVVTESSDTHKNQFICDRSISVTYNVTATYAHGSSHGLPVARLEHNLLKNCWVLPSAEFIRLVAPRVALELWEEWNVQEWLHFVLYSSSWPLELTGSQSQQIIKD